MGDHQHTQSFGRLASEEQDSYLQIYNHGNRVVIASLIDDGSIYLIKDTVYSSFCAAFHFGLLGWSLIFSPLYLRHTFSVPKVHMDFLLKLYVWYNP